MVDDQEYLGEAVSVRIEAFEFALKASHMLINGPENCTDLIKYASEIEAFLIGKDA